MFLRILLLLTVVALSAAAGPADAERIAAGDPLSKVYTTLGSPVLEYPLNGRLIQEYRQCTIISENKVVVSAQYKEVPSGTAKPVEKDRAPSIEEITELAERGDAESQYLLAYCYQFGMAVEQDDRAAIPWYRKAAMQGHMPSQHNLGIIYMNGKGIERDYVEAYTWALLAAESGNSSLMEVLDLKISESDRAIARKKAQQLRIRMKKLREASASAKRDAEPNTAAPAQ